MSGRSFKDLDVPSKGAGRSRGFSSTEPRAVKKVSHDDWNVQSSSRKHEFRAPENKGRAKTADDLDSFKSAKAKVDLSETFKPLGVEQQAKAPKTGALAMTGLAVKSIGGALMDRSPVKDSFKPSLDLFKKPEHELTMFDRISMQHTSDKNSPEKNLQQMQHTANRFSSSKKLGFAAKLADRIDRAYNKGPREAMAKKAAASKPAAAPASKPAAAPKPVSAPKSQPKDG